jgi:site-specific DNA-methyltransferase (adenine-specific)
LVDTLHPVGIESVDAVVTSPPYLGVLRYGAFNWIRLWFLGFEPSAIDRSLDATDSLEKYLSFVTSVLMSIAEVVPPGSPVILVIGDVEEAGRRLELAERVWEELDGLVPFELLDIDVDLFDETTKTTRIWGEKRKGRATPLDRVLILERVAKAEEQRAAEHR